MLAKVKVEEHSPASEGLHQLHQALQWPGDRDIQVLQGIYASFP